MSQKDTNPFLTPPDQLQRYGKYFLVRKLAEGGMAEIFLAKQAGAEGFERNVVIKRMLKHLSDEPSFVAMFLDEARLAARLAHQNIVQIHDLGLADGCYFICMEYLAGEDLSTILRSAGRRREYAPIPLVVRALAEAAHGLHFAHDFTDESGKPLHIVHRDISPSNIFVTYQGQVKVLDFGIARAESRSAQTNAGVVKGKYMYMAPEQARGNADQPVDRRADVFSLGVSLYEGLTNIRPFAKDNDLAILNAVLHGDFKPPRAHRPDLPVELEQIVLRAMSLKPAERFQTAADFASALERYLASQTPTHGAAATTAYLRALFGDERVTFKSRIPSLDSLIQSGRTVPGSAPLSAPPAVPPKRGAMIAAVAAAVVLLGGGGAFVWMRPDAPAPAQPVVAAAVIPPVPASPPPVAPAPAAEEPAAKVAAAEEPGAAAEEPEKPAPVKKASAPITLTANDIQKVVNRGREPIMRCFDQFKSDLPADEGQVTVQFTILGSGKVTGATVGGPLSSSRVGACLQKRVSALRFPAHKDREVTLGLPFQYKVQR